MAKKAVSPIELHVEKLVLGLTVLVLAGAAFRYLVNSPNTIEYPIGQPQGPSEIDAKIAAQAQMLQQKVASAKPHAFETESLVSKLVEQREDPLGYHRLNPQLPAPREFSTFAVPEIGAIKETKTFAKADILAPNAPTFRVGRSTISAPAAGRGVDHMDVVWVSLGSTFDAQAQEAAFQKKGYDEANAKVIFTGVALQRRQLNPDGDWADWVDVEPFMTTPPPPVPELKMQGDEVVTSSRNVLQTYAKDIGENQSAVRRPPIPKVTAGEPWSPPEIPGVNVAELLKEGEGEKKPGREQRRPPPKRRVAIPRNFDDAKKKAEGYQKKEQWDQIIAMDEAIQEQNPEWYQNLTRPEKAEYDRALILAKRRAGVKEDKEPAEAKPGGAGEPGDQDDDAIWAYDTGVEPGGTYQYRMAAKLFNTLAGTTLAPSPEMSASVELIGDWSEPTTAVTVPDDTLFFLTRVTDTAVDVEVFKWANGGWNVEKFTVRPGDPIGEVKEDRRANTTVDYSTNATVVQIRQDEKSLQPRGDTQKGFSRFEEEVGPVLVFLDRNGHLDERNLARDKDDPRPKEIKRELRRR
jgi:hypothetical protein